MVTNGLIGEGEIGQNQDLKRGTIIIITKERKGGNFPLNPLLGPLYSFMESVYAIFPCMNNNYTTHEILQLLS